MNSLDWKLNCAKQERPGRFSSSKNENVIHTNLYILRTMSIKKELGIGGILQFFCIAFCVNNRIQKWEKKGLEVLCAIFECCHAFYQYGGTVTTGPILGFLKTTSNIDTGPDCDLTIKASSHLSWPSNSMFD